MMPTTSMTTTTLTTPRPAHLAWRVLFLATAATASALSVGCQSDQVPGMDPRTFSVAKDQVKASQGLAPSATVVVPDKMDETLFNKNARRDELEGHYKKDPLLNTLNAQPRVVLVDLRTAIQRAVVSNLDVRVAAFQPGIDEARVTEAEARFDPTFIANIGLTKDQSANFSNNLSGTPGDLWTATAQVGFQQLLESGGQLKTTLDYNFYNNNLTNGLGNGDFYVANLGLELTQPLLRDFGNEINRARIDINKNNQHISLLEFRNTLEDQLTKLEQTYWQLVQAQREVEIQQELLQRTIDTAVILALRQNQDVTRVQLSQANFSIEQRRAQLVRARARVADLSDQLKRLINDPSVPVAGPDLLLPATPPVMEQIIYSPTEVIGEAVRYRPEVGQQQLRIDSALIAMNVAKNNKLPRLDLTGRVSVQNVDTDQAAAPIFGLGEVTGGWQGAGAVQLALEIPIGNRAALSIEKRAQLQYQQALIQYHGLSLQVTEETSRALREVDTTYSEIARTRQARYAANEALRALQVREDNNEPLTPQFVDQKLRQQEQLAQAQRDESAAVAGYNVALSQLERAKGTLLRYNNVTLQEDALSK